MPTLKLYAHLVSQPSRAVAWLLKVQGVEYEFVETEIGGAYIKSDEFLAKNPNGKLPVLQDDAFTLFESNAILTYLAEKYNWEDLYPTKDLQTRGKINEYLHWHHTNARLFTSKVVLPYVHCAVGAATPEDMENIKGARVLIAKVTDLVEKLLVKDFVAHTSTPTIADYALYCEYDQLETMALLDLTEFPKTKAWIARMKQIKYHDEIRETMHGVFAAIKLTGVGKSTELPTSDP